jgi:hypothetical protein
MAGRSNLHLQILRNRGELLQCGLQVFHDVEGDHAGGGEVGAFFEGVILEPEDVEVDLVAFDQVGVVEGFESFGFLAAVAVLGVVVSDEVIQVLALQRVFHEGEVLVGAKVVDPELLRPRFFLRGFAVKEEDVRFHALGAEDAGGQSQQGVDVGLVEQFTADGFPGSAFEEHVVRQHHGSSTMHLEDGEDVLEKVELLVAGAVPEVLPIDGQRLLGLLARTNSEVITACSSCAFLTGSKN